MQRKKCVWGSRGQLGGKTGWLLVFWMRIFIFAEGKNENARLIFDFWLLRQSQWLPQSLLQYLKKSYEGNKHVFGALNTLKAYFFSFKPTFSALFGRSFPEVTYRKWKNAFFGTAYHYPTTLVISGDPEKLIENEILVIKNWPEIDKLEKLTFFNKSS